MEFRGTQDLLLPADDDEDIDIERLLVRQSKKMPHACVCGVLFNFYCVVCAERWKFEAEESKGTETKAETRDFQTRTSSWQPRQSAAPLELT